MRYTHVVLLFILCFTITYAQDTTATTYLMQHGQSAICHGDMKIPAQASNGSVMAACESMPTEDQVEQRLQQERQATDESSPIVVTLGWDAPATMDDGTPYDPLALGHYTVYMCDAPIIAGGANQNDPLVSPASCSGKMMTAQVSDEEVEATYPVVVKEGTLYYRVSAVTKDGKESTLTNQISHTFQFTASARTGPPQNFRILIEAQKSKSR